MKSLSREFWRGNIIKISVVILFTITLTACGGGGGGGTVTTSSADIDTSGYKTLSWESPVTDMDGTPLIDLAGYKIYYGQGSGNYTNEIDIGNATSYTFTDLSPGTWCFTVKAYDSSGLDSDASDEVCT